MGIMIIPHVVITNENYTIITWVYTTVKIYHYTLNIFVLYLLQFYFNKNDKILNMNAPRNVCLS